MSVGCCFGGTPSCTASCHGRPWSGICCATGHVKHRTGLMYACAQAGSKSGSAAAAAPGSENVDPEQSERPAKKRKGKAKKGAAEAEVTGKRS